MKRIYQVISTCVVCFFMAAGAHAYDITLAWDPTSEMNIAGYNLYARIDNSDYNLVYTLTLDEVDPANPQFVGMDLEMEPVFNFFSSSAAFQIFFLGKIYFDGKLWRCYYAYKIPKELK